MQDGRPSRLMTMELVGIEFVIDELFFELNRERVIEINLEPKCDRFGCHIRLVNLWVESVGLAAEGQARARIETARRQSIHRPTRHTPSD